MKVFKAVAFLVFSSSLIACGTQDYEEVESKESASEDEKPEPLRLNEEDETIGAEPQTRMSTAELKSYIDQRLLEKEENLRRKIEAAAESLVEHERKTTLLTHQSELSYYRTQQMIIGGLTGGVVGLVMSAFYRSRPKKHWKPAKESGRSLLGASLVGAACGAIFSRVSSSVMRPFIPVVPALTDSAHSDSERAESVRGSEALGND